MKSKGMKNYKGGGKKVARSAYFSSKKPKIREHVTFKGKTR